MHFMVLIFGSLLGATLWAFFHYNPRGVDRGRLLAYNVLALVAAVPIAWGTGAWIYAAGAGLAEKKAMVWYLAGMAGGTAFLIAVTVAGLVRNFVVFPLSRRDPAGAGTAPPPER